MFPLAHINYGVDTLILDILFTPKIVALSHPRGIFFSKRGVC